MSRAIAWSVAAALALTSTGCAWAEPPPRVEDAAIAGVKVVDGPSDYLAVWSRRHIFLSRDDGRSFAPVLEAGGHVVDVAVTADGVVWAIRGGRLGRRTQDGDETWQPAPTTPGHKKRLAEHQVDPTLRRGTSLAAAPGWVTIALVQAGKDEPMVAIFASADGGRSWLRSRPGLLTAGGRRDGVRVETHIGSDGTIEALVEWAEGLDCAVGYTTVFRGRAGARRLEQVNERMNVDIMNVGHDGWWYQIESDELVSHRPTVDDPGSADDDWPRAGFRTRSDDLLVFRNRATTVGSDGRELFSLAGGRATRLGVALPRGFSLRVIDGAARPLATARGPGKTWRLVRWDGARGWRALPGG